MAFVIQRIGRGEKEERGIPIAHEIAHQRLFVAEHEARNHDQKFRSHDQECEPGKAERAGKQRNHETGDDQGHVHPGSNPRDPGEVVGSGVAKQQACKVFRTQEGDRGVCDADEKDGPEQRPDEIDVEAVNQVGVPAQRAVLAGKHQGNGDGQGDGIEPDLNPGGHGSIGAKPAQSGKPEPDDQRVICKECGKECQHRPSEDP